MSPYERARADPAFLERFARAYRGDDDPLDALWWQEHPADAAPSGAPSAAQDLAGLRHAVYGRRPDRATLARYRRLQDRLDREQAAVRDALAVAQSPGAGSPSAHPGAAAPPPDAAPPRRPPPVLVVAGAAVVAFAAGVLVAPALGGGVASRPTATPVPAETAPFVSGASGTDTALAIFGEPQRDVDRPPVGIGARLLPQTFHRLRAVPSRGVDIYAAEDSAGDVCLVAVSVEARLTAACAPTAAFRAAPIRLAFRADRYRDGTTKTGTQVELVATWGFFSPFDLEETPVGRA